jgi:hypothetical protein
MLKVLRDNLKYLLDPLGRHPHLIALLVDFAADS